MTTRAPDPPRPASKGRLGRRLVWTTAGVVCLCVLGASAHRIWVEQEELSRRLDARGATLCEIASFASVESLLVGDYPVLDTFVEELVSENDEVVYARIERADGRVVRESIRQDTEDLPESARTREYRSDIVVPGSNGKPIGSIVLGLSTAQLDRAQRDSWHVALLQGGLLIIAVGGLLAFLLRRSVVQPLAVLERQAARLGRGDLDRPIAIPSDDELGRLAETLDRVRLDLRASYAELQSANADLVRAHAAKDQALEELERALGAARAAGRAKSEFLATMSHEIRTPLNGILGAANLLLAHGLDRERSELAETVRGSAEHLRAIVDDVLDFVSAESDGLRLEPDACDLRDLVQATCSTIAIEAARKGLTLRWYWQDDVPSHVLVDEGRLRRVLLNLIGNAVKFTVSGGVTVQVSCDGEIEERMLVRIAVLDTGPGIDAPLREKLFEPFTQRDSSSRRVHGGTGLGLAFCKAILERMGGEIGVQSQPGRGSLFWVRLAVPVLDAAPQPAPALPATPPVRDGRRLLVVEDNPVNQRLVLSMLKHGGYRAEAATSGEEAIERRASGRYDLVLMDCSMPGMDGFECTRRIRAREAAGEPRVPILALTANALPGDRERCLEAGMDEYLAKPFTPAQLYQAIEQLLAEAGAHGAPLADEGGSGRGPAGAGGSA